MNEIVRKLQIKNGHVGKILNLPDELQDKFSDWPAELLSNKRTNLDYVVVFVKSIKEIKKLAAPSIKLICTDGLLWFGYPKKTSKIRIDISRDNGWEILATLGYRPVRLISLDKNWSIFRFRDKSLVKK